jgi:hypothetical protein
LSLWGVVSPSLLIHGRVGLDRVGGHARAPAKPHESGVYDNGGVGYMLCARGSCICCSGGGIRHGMHGVLRVKIRCAIKSISSLSAIVQWPGAASLDPLGNPAYGGLGDRI